MGRGLDARLRALEHRWDDRHRYVDAALRLAVYRRSDDPDDDAGVPTGQVSPLIGGVWDRHLRRIAPDRKPGRIIEAPVSLEQYDYCLDTTTRLMGKGGRGGGKSEALAEKCRTLLLQDPLVRNILILSPDFPHTTLMWAKVFRRIQPWIRPGGVHAALREFHTIFGCVVKFMSAHNPESVRGFGAAVGLLDEEKDISAVAYDNFLLCIRLGGRKPHIAGVGTPEAGGEYEERWSKFADDPGAAQHSFPSRSNPFISPEIFEVAKRVMDERRYRQEVLAEFVAMNQYEFVFRDEFSREEHGVRYPMPGWNDITRRVTKKRLGKSFQWVAGVDYNEDSPNVAHLYQVYAPGPGESRNRWVLRDIVKEGSHAGWLADALIKKGYTPQKTVIIDDASGEYNAPGGKKAPNTSARLMRDKGFRCVHPKKNPPVRDRVHAFLSKLKPVEGNASWFYDRNKPEVAAVVERTAMLLKWKPGGKDMDKEDMVDHDFDAMTYPIAHFEPAARLQIPGLTL